MKNLIFISILCFLFGFGLTYLFCFIKSIIKLRKHHNKIKRKKTINKKNIKKTIYFD